jgi:dephospho-CoA kinase
MCKNWRPWAITGGIAEGKSTVLGYLADAGYRTLSADAVAREVFETSEMQSLIREHLRTRDRQELRQLISVDPGARRQLNTLMHGPVWKAILDQEPQFVEVPLLIETVLHPFCMGVWVVTCGESEQRRRLSERFSGDTGKAEALIQAQLPSRVKTVFADRVFDSNLPEPHVRREVLEAVSCVFRQ